MQVSPELLRRNLHPFLIRRLCNFCEIIAQKRIPPIDKSPSCQFRALAPLLPRTQIHKRHFPATLRRFEQTGQTGPFRCSADAGGDALFFDYFLHRCWPYMYSLSRWRTWHTLVQLLRLCITLWLDRCRSYTRRRIVFRVLTMGFPVNLPITLLNHAPVSCLFEEEVVQFGIWRREIGKIGLYGLELSLEFSL